MNASWKKFRTAVRFLQMAKAPSERERVDRAGERELLAQRVAILQKPPAERVDADLAVIDDILKQVKFTADLPLRVRREICKSCTHKQGGAGLELFKQGDAGHECFIILSGMVSCSAINTSTGQASVVARLTAHQSFGEKGLQSENSHRQETVTLESRCDFLVISRDSFDVINQHLQSSETRKKVEYLRRVGVFAHVPESSLQMIATAMAARTCPKNSVIKRQGSDSTEIFFLVTGTCRVIRDVTFSSRESLQLSTLSLVRDAIDSASNAAAGRRRPADAPDTILGLPLAPTSAAGTIVLPALLAFPHDSQADSSPAEIPADTGTRAEEESRVENGERSTDREADSEDDADAFVDGDTAARSLISPETPEALEPERSQTRVSFQFPSDCTPLGAGKPRQSEQTRAQRLLDPPPAREAESAPTTSGRNGISDALPRVGSEAKASFSKPGSNGKFAPSPPLEPFFPAGINSSHGERIYPWERSSKSPRRPRSRSPSPTRAAVESPSARAARANADPYSSKQLTVTQMLRSMPKRKEKSRRLFLELGQVHPPAYFGEVGVLRNETRRTSIVAATNVEVYVMSKLDFQVRVGRDIVKQMEQRIPEFPTDESIRKLFLRNVLWSNYKAALVSEVTAHRTGNGKPTSAVPLPSANFRQPDGQTVRLPRLLERKTNSPAPNLKLMKGAVMSIPT